MRQFKLKKGLDLPISGAPKQEIGSAPTVKSVAILGDDYIGLKPRIVVEEGDSVVCGAPVMFDKSIPEAQIVSPVAGRVRAINRGARRKLVSIEIDVADSEKAPVDFSKTGDAKTREGLTEKLCAAGLWTSFRTRPYSKVPQPGTVPDAIYVTATDTEPLAANPAIAIEEDIAAFECGLEAIAKLTDGTTYLCQSIDLSVSIKAITGVEAIGFCGPHPSGLAGTHLHFLEPPSTETLVWTIGYQDVIVIGRLVLTGVYDASCILSLAGPACGDPRLVRAIAGSSMTELAQNDLPQDIPVRTISGSVLSGRAGEGVTGYLGRYARQITVIEEDHKQIPLGWIRPMATKYAVQPVLGSAFVKKVYDLTSNLNGGRRAMVPLGTFEELMPQDYLPTQLLRAMLVMDTDQAQQLGVLELDEEDLGLVGFACPAKYEYGMALRDCLTKIEKEG